MNKMEEIREITEELRESFKTARGLHFDLKSIKLDEIRLLIRIFKLGSQVINATGDPVNKASKNDLINILVLNLHDTKDNTLSALKERIKERKEKKQKKSSEMQEKLEYYTEAEVIEEIPQEKKKEEKKEKEPKTDIQLSLGMDIGGLLSQSITEFVHQQGPDIMHKVIRGQVDEALKDIKPIIVKVPNKPDIEIKDRTHIKFKDVLFSSKMEQQVMIVGPAGSGKTTLAEQIAKALGVRFAHISCSAGMSEAHLLGRMLFDGEYVQSDLVHLYENGGLFLFDEIDAADSNTLLVINSALANGYMSVPNRKDKPIAKRHENFYCIVSGNSWGHGSVTYSGRNNLDGAFLDRFTVAKHEVSYDIELEKEISKEFPEVANEFHRIRGKVEKNNLKRIVSTRAIVSGVRQRKAGKNMKFITDTFFTGWTKEELAKVK